ncbi:unnamed protein product [Blepharisma stoltei]|uniref:Uncharacterized protein n=1 Tax=Blepharisma stoltei TaxID=1481888 RepID=A0AAU9JHN7_9CILI|nr:unnamed protein product [Blepharisma stoltei]
MHSRRNSSRIIITSNETHNDPIPLKIKVLEPSKSTVNLKDPFLRMCNSRKGTPSLKPMCASAKQTPESSILISSPPTKPKEPKFLRRLFPSPTRKLQKHASEAILHIPPPSHRPNRSELPKNPSFSKPFSITKDTKSSKNLPPFLRWNFIPCEGKQESSRKLQTPMFSRRKSEYKPYASEIMSMPQSPNASFRRLNKQQNMNEEVAKKLNFLIQKEEGWDKEISFGNIEVNEMNMIFSRKVW